MAVRKLENASSNDMLSEVIMNVDVSNSCMVAVVSGKL